MSLFDALLREVIDRPDDDEPRLILGDWLLDQPDHGSQARGEFLHTQVQLARLELDDPARAELEMRQAQLLPEYPQKWARPFRRAGVKGWSFGRGLVEGLTLRPGEFDRLKDLIVREQPVQRLRLLGEGWTRRLRDWSGMGRIRSLEINHQTDHLDVLRLPRLTGLRELHLRDRSVWYGSASAGTTALATIPCLGTLETLDLRVSGPEPATREVILRVERTPRLRSLSILHMAGVAAALPRLHSLHLQAGNLAMLGQSIARTASALRSLVLSACFAPDVDTLAPLLRQPALAGLRSLEVRQMPLGDPRGLIDLLGKGRLVRLVLDDALLGQLRALTRAGCLANLRELAVTRSPSPPLAQDARDLAAADLRALGSLSLCGYQLKVDSINDLLAAPWIDQLHTLALRSCKLHPHSVAALTAREWPRLALLDLRDNELSKEAQERLRARFGVKVRY